MSRRRRLLVAAAAAAGALVPLAGFGSPARAVTVPICFPVADSPVTYVGNFGDPRGGGTRTHEGEDIMGRPMFRIVAPVAGVILAGRDGIRWRGTGDAEHSLRMRGDDGYYYAFLHLNDDTPGTDDDLAGYEQVFGPGIAPGVRVVPGQVLAYMGDSGNAGEGNDHLHFEMRAPGTPATSVWASTAFDPWDSLQASRRCDLPNPVMPLGGVARSDPDAASDGAGRLDVAVRGTDDQLWIRRWTGSTWTGWTTAGGQARSGPALASPRPGQLSVFVRGTDDALYQRIRTDGSWGPWMSLGGVLTGDPDVASAGDGTTMVVVRGTDGAIWEQRFDGTRWSGWASLGGRTPEAPTVAAMGGGRYDVFVRGTDDQLYGRTVHGEATGPWVAFGGVLTSPPEATGEAGTAHIVVRGTDARLWHRRVVPGATWQLLRDGTVDGSVGLASWGRDRVDVFFATADRALHQTWWDPSGW